MSNPGPGKGRRGEAHQGKAPDRGCCVVKGLSAVQTRGSGGRMGASCNSQEGFPGRGLRGENSRIPRATCLVVGGVNWLSPLKPRGS